MPLPPRITCGIAFGQVLLSGAARCVHDDGDAAQADGGCDDVVSVGAELVDRDAPGEGAGDEDAAVGGQDPAEVRVGLAGGDETVGAEGGDAGADEQQAAVFADALPDQPGAADFGDRGQGSLLANASSAKIA